MLDALPRIPRHILIGLLYVVLSWVSTDLLPTVSPWLAAHPPLGPLAGALAAQLLLVVLPLVRYRSQPDGRHEDTGSVRSVLAVLLVAAAVIASAVLVVISLARAPKASAAPRPVEHVAVWSARTCAGVLDVGFGLEQLRHHGAWVTQLDDGDARVELHHVGAAAGPGGHWEAYSSTSGGEGHLRVDVVGLPAWDAVRVLHGGYVSTQRLPEARCTA